jgi:hypothetical protein
VVYRASNWKYLGEFKQHCKRLIVDGKEIHPRMAQDKFHTTKADEIAKLGHSVELREREPKHKFSYVLEEP